MENFESLLETHRGAVERFVRWRIGNREDAEDILQETYLAAFRRFHQLRSQDSFKAWMLSIARNKCADHYRERPEAVPLEEVPEGALVQSRYGLREESPVADTLDALGEREREMLLLYYFEELKQEEIARRLQIPLGTVKSRLYAAKKQFRKHYPCPPKGETNMLKKTLPEIMPEYRIIPRTESAFPVVWEELMGWFIVPKEGEKLAWAMYDFPERKRGEYVELTCSGRAEIHGIQGTVIRAKEYDAMPCNRIDGTNFAARTFVAQLTDTHCRILAESHRSGGVERLHTFLDGEDFLPNWGFGEDNCGNEIHISPKGDIQREGDRITAKEKPFLLDVVGRYTVEIGGKSCDTVCVMDIETYDAGVATEQFLDREGRTVLWRRFNRDDWQVKAGDRTWSQRLPENEVLWINGMKYVHWYDCITDRIFGTPIL